MVNKSHLRSILSRLRLFSRTLGWPPVSRVKKSINGRVIYFYEVGQTTLGRDHFALTIHACNLDDSRCDYSAAVYAIRYRICSGSHVLSIPDKSSAIREAQRLDVWLGNHWFSDRVSRRAYRNLHPECAGYSWATLRRSHLPYINGERVLPAE